MTDTDTKLIPRCGRCDEPVHNDNHSRITPIVTDCHNTFRVTDVKNPTRGAQERRGVMLNNV